MAQLNTIFKDIQPVSRNLKTLSSITSVLLGERLDKSEDLSVKQESPLLKRYLDEPLQTKTDIAVKMSVAVAVAIAKKRNVEAIKADTPMELAAAVDDGITRMKVAYQVGKGVLNSTAAADEIIDRTAARVVSFTDKVIDAGVPTVALAITKAASNVCPRAAVLAPVIEIGMRFVGNAAKKVISKGVQAVAGFAKNAVRAAAGKVEKLSRGLKKLLFG